MQVFVQIKSFHRNKPALTCIAYSLPDSINTLRQLLVFFAESDAKIYNQKSPDALIFPPLTQQQIDDAAATGKVDFGRTYTEEKVAPAIAAANAIQCWKDGLIRVFQNDFQLSELDQPISISENDVFTFIRLTLLSGRHL